MDNPRGGWNLEIELCFHLRSDIFSSLKEFKKWVFCCDFAIKRLYGNWHAFWPYCWVNILGVEFGVGFIKTWYRTKEESK